MGQILKHLDNSLNPIKALKYTYYYPDLDEETEAERLRNLSKVTG